MKMFDRLFQQSCAFKYLKLLFHRLLQCVINYGYVEGWHNTLPMSPLLRWPANKLHLGNRPESSRIQDNPLCHTACTLLTWAFFFLSFSTRRVQPLKNRLCTCSDVFTPFWCTLRCWFGNTQQQPVACSGMGTGFAA